MLNKHKMYKSLSISESKPGNTILYMYLVVCAQVLYSNFNKITGTGRLKKKLDHVLLTYIFGNL